MDARTSPRASDPSSPARTAPRRTPRDRDDRGVAFPSPVVMITIIAVAMAAIAFVATRHPAPTERRIDSVAQQHPSATKKSPKPSATPSAKPVHHAPVIKRGSVSVEVFNNSRITGLAARVAARAGSVGWDVVGDDNWYGTIPASTVYFPPRMKAAGKQLALDLGIQRTAPAVDPMKDDVLTVILTGPLT